MHTTPKNRRFAKWAWLIATVTYLGLYVSTLPAAFVWSGQRQDRRTDIAFTGGSGIFWSWGPSSQTIARGWRIDRAPAAFSWTNITWLPRFSSNTRGWSVRLPLWPPVLISAIIAMFLWYRDRPRPLPGHCKRCNYNLTGNQSGTCPECGNPTSTFNPFAPASEPPKGPPAHEAPAP